MKALLSRLGFDKKLVALENKRVWEKLLCADTQHYAAGLLAREMRRGLSPLCPHMASHLLSLLVGKQPCWDLPALAFFVELLECLDLSKHGPSALLVVSRHLLSQCRGRLRLALRGLVVLSKEPSLAGGICCLYPHLVEQLADPDAEVVWMSLCVLTHALQDKDLLLPSVTTLKLAESLLPHFENDNSHVQLLSIQLFCKVMELVVEEGEELLTTFVNQSLLPLFLRWHDENLYVAKASFQALLCAARFLRRRDLEELLIKAWRIKFAESLVRTARELEPCPQCSVWGAGSCGPAQHRSRARQPAPTLLLPALCRAGRLGRCWGRESPAEGLSLCRAFPAGAPHSCCRTRAEQPRAHRGPCERQPSGSWLFKP
ncbi:maestro heat-like repeat-containing protein family member 2B [Zonotrichia leucophrys gambelii]|uniref:maestro heat-like repeat-containing protein family member 2B n=1 Tax=Zonotrichia leucophrys gambelii TaxID=257770 RepID=UPI0031405EAE